MITFTQRGSFNRTNTYLRGLKEKNLAAVLNKYGSLGVDALSNATPVKTGMTSTSWYYTIEQKRGYISIRWHNSNRENGAPVAILIQYGHGIRNGGYVQGRDYINPAIRPIFDKAAAEVWKEVTK